MSVLDEGTARVDASENSASVRRNIVKGGDDGVDKNWLDQVKIRKIAQKSCS